MQLVPLVVLSLVVDELAHVQLDRYGGSEGPDFDAVIVPSVHIERDILELLEQNDQPEPL